ncbi:MAG: 50S ribosomal protein L35 [Calditrichia bacterium]
MPKMKSNRGASKRFKLTGKGKVKYKSNYKSHILTKKTTKRKRNLRKKKIMFEGEARRVRKMILAE